MDSLYIVIPAYNEADNIKSVIDDWYPIVEKYNGDGKSRLVIVNDGSKDATYDILCRCAKDKPLLCPLDKENGGHGDTVLLGYQYALDNGADYIFQTDSDGQTLAAEFSAFWEQRKEYDMLIGYRNQRQDGISRKIVTRVLRLAVRVCFGVKIEDANTPFRLMESTSLKGIVADIPEHYNLANVIVSVLYEKRGMRTKYIPITFRPRQGGVNSINIPKIFGIGKRAVRDFRILNQTMRK